VSFMAVPWLRQLVAGLSPRRSGFNSKQFLFRYVVDKVALGKVCHTVLRSSHITISPPLLHICLQQDKREKPEEPQTRQCSFRYRWSVCRTSTFTAFVISLSRRTLPIELVLYLGLDEDPACKKSR